MFVGHYAASFAAKKTDATIPLWVLFIAVQLLDVAWAPLVLLGVEKARITPGITASNPLDLYYMPYTHSLVAALVWSAGALAIHRLVTRRATLASGLVIAAAIFSHWVLDFVVHRPDLPLYDNAAKVGLGLWDLPAIAFSIEATLLFVGMWLYFSTGAPRRAATLVFGIVMLAIQAYVFFGPPPRSDKAAASTAILSYAIFAVVIRLLEESTSHAQASSGSATFR